MRQIILIFGIAFATTVFGMDKLALENEQTDAGIMHNIISSRSEASLEETIGETIRQYMKQHEISSILPMTGSTVTLDARNLDDEVFNLRLKFGSDTEEQARKKSKIKKIFIPILVFILLKAITLIPLGLGVLGIKTWNAIQLSFISFVSALIMAVWKLCAKVNNEPHPQIIHNAWEPHYHDRSDSQQRPYSAYVQHDKFVRK